MFSLYKSVKSNWSKTSFFSTVSLFSFCFPDQFIEESGVLKSPITTVSGAMCDLSFSKDSLTNEGALAFGA